MNNKKMRLMGALAIGLSLTGAQQIAYSADTTTTFTVGATVLTTCIVVALPLSFGNYDPTSSTATDSTNDLAVTCTAGTPYNVKLGQGVNGTSVTDRKMVNALSSDTLNYALFRDAGRTQNWGETIGTNTSAGTGTGLPQTVTVYGRIPANQASSAGVYSDTITVTVTY